jgi:hypothetical protein
MFKNLNMDSERIPRSLLRGLASELQQIDILLAWKIPCTLMQGASIFIIKKGASLYGLAFLVNFTINFSNPMDLPPFLQKCQRRRG